MSCDTLGRWVGPYISDPYARAQAELECAGQCAVNGNSCVSDYAVADCATCDLIPDNFPVNI